MEIKRCYSVLVGASVAENQLIHYPTSGTTYGGVTFTVNNNVIELSGTANASWINCFGSHTTKAKHVYLIDTTKFADPNNTNITIGSLNSYINTIIGTSKMFKPSGSVYDGLGVQSYGGSGTDLSGIKFSAKIIDLSLYLPANIVDYAYALESATAGSGIAWLRSYGFLRDYQAYNAGTIESVEVTEKKCVGFNQWDEEWEVGGYADATGGVWNTTDRIRSKANNYIPILPNTNYFFKAPLSLNVYWYDADKNYIGTDGGYAPNTVHMTPSNAYYMRFALYAGITTYNHDICINLSNPDRNGEYEAYTSQTYDYGDDTLRGIFKLDANNNLYADGDVKTSDGTITRKMKSKTLEQVDVTYSPNNSGYANIAYARITKPSDAKGLNSANPLLILLDGYVTSSATSRWDTTDKIGYLFYGADTAYWWVGFPHGTTIEQMKTALAGKELIYELATPTTETSTPFTSPQIVYPDGTEEFITENNVPVGHETEYQL